MLGTYASFDAGQTWQDNGPLMLPPGTNFGDDITVAFDRQGIGFVAAMATVLTQTGPSQVRGVYVWRTDDGGRSFHAPVAAMQGAFADHPWLAIDTTPGPRIGLNQLLQR